MRPAYEYANHARAIARRWGVRMVEDSGLGKDEAHAEPAMRAVVHAPIVDDTSYVVSMHEIGHVLHANGSVRDKIQAKTRREDIRLRLVEEEAAWEWARENVLDGEWTAGMESVMRVTLKTYTDERDWLEQHGDLPFDVSSLLDAVLGQQSAPAYAHDPMAVQRRAEAYRVVAMSLIERIKKGGRS